MLREVLRSVCLGVAVSERLFPLLCLFADFSRRRICMIKVSPIGASLLPLLSRPSTDHLPSYPVTSKAITSSSPKQRRAPPFKSPTSGVASKGSPTTRNRQRGLCSNVSRRFVDSLSLQLRGHTSLLGSRSSFSRHPSLSRRIDLCRAPLSVPGYRSSPHCLRADLRVHGLSRSRSIRTRYARVRLSFKHGIQ